MTALLAWALPLHANVFGDGDPANGIEDDRQAVVSARGDGLGWQTAGGTIHCDGQLRGSAMVLDLSALAPQTHGLVLATAAHVLVDLEQHVPYAQCAFHAQGLSRIPGMQVAIDPSWSRKGDFRVGADLTAPGFGAGDWAFIRLPADWPGALHAGRVRPRAWREVAAQVPGYLLVGWDASAGRMGYSDTCTVNESVAQDLGGGAWPGQLLDDCDSGLGASGGGLLARTAEGVFLVGIRSGAHWSASVYPADRFPAGPPEGARWDAAGNTNFARALDEVLLAQLRSWLVDTEASHSVVATAPDAVGGSPDSRH